MSEIIIVAESKQSLELQSWHCFAALWLNTEVSKLIGKPSQYTKKQTNVAWMYEGLAVIMDV